MSDQTNASPDVVPAYGEAGAEAESMDRTAEGKTADRSEAVNASEKVLPPDVPVESHGTTETDIPARIAETAERTGQT